MSENASIANLKGHLAKAIEQEDWQMAESFLERAKVLLLNASTEGKSDDLRAIRKVLADLYARLAASRNMSARLDASGVTWMIRADAATAAVAEVQLPATFRLVRLEDGSARARILTNLANANRGRSNREISELTDLATETVSRVLSLLTTDGKVRSARAGRRRMNYITEAGRSELAGETMSGLLERRKLSQFMSMPKGIALYTGLKSELGDLSSKDLRLKAKSIQKFHVRTDAQIIKPADAEMESMLTGHAKLKIVGQAA